MLTNGAAPVAEGAKVLQTGMFWGRDSVGEGLGIFAPSSKDLATSKAAKFAPEHSFGPKITRDETKPLPTGDDANDPIPRVLVSDPITEALTTPSNAPDEYYNVLRALISAVRTELVPLSDETIFKTPPADTLGVAFPDTVVSEDAVYFHRKAVEESERAFKSSEAFTALAKAYAATDEKIRYAFDRRPIPPAPKPAKLKRSGGGSGGGGGGGGSSGGGGDGSPLPKLTPQERGITKSHANRLEAPKHILHSQGRDMVSTVRDAIGGPAAVDTALATGSTGDTVSNALRWAEQQRVAAAHKRARCEHSLHLLSNEMDEEAKRQQRLRRAAARFAASTARKRGEDWSSYAIGLTDEDPKKNSLKAQRAAAIASGVDPHITAKSLRYKDPRKAPGALGGDGGGLFNFSATDLAKERFEVAKERAEAADAIMRVLEDYRLIPVTVAAQYLEATMAEVESAYAAMVGGDEAARLKAQILAEEEEAEMRTYRLRREKANASIRQELAARGEAAAAAAMLESSSRAATAGGFALGNGAKEPAAPLPHQQHQQQQQQQVQGQYFIKQGAATPLEEHEDVKELAYAAVTGGLSAFNLRPHTVRKAVREAMVLTFPDLDEGFKPPPRLKKKPVLNPAHPFAASARPPKPAAAASASGAASSGGSALVSGRSKRSGASTVGGGSRVKSKGRGKGKGKGKGSGKAGSTAGGEGGEGASTSPSTRAGELQRDEGSGGRDLYDSDTDSGGGSEEEDREATERAAAAAKAAKDKEQEQVVGMLSPADKAAGVMDKPDRSSPEWLKKMRKMAHVGSSSGKAGKKAGGGGGGDDDGGAPKVLDSTNFTEVENALLSWTLGTRPEWQESILKQYDLSNMRESTGMLLDIIKRRALEPPDGRYSHLLGRYMPADMLREQLRAELAQKRARGLA